MWRAVLCCDVPCCGMQCRAVPRYPVLCCAVLCCAVLCCAALCCVALRRAALCFASLCCAVLWVSRTPWSGAERLRRWSHWRPYCVGCEGAVKAWVMWLVGGWRAWYHLVWFAGSLLLGPGRSDLGRRADVGGVVPPWGLCFGLVVARVSGGPLA